MAGRRIVAGAWRRTPHRSQGAIAPSRTLLGGWRDRAVVMNDDAEARSQQTPETHDILIIPAAPPPARRQLRTPDDAPPTPLKSWPKIMYT